MQTQKPYCVYITIYSGENLPPFYIGSKDTLSVENGYFGSVSSQRFSKIWKQELTQFSHLFDILIISYHDTRAEAFNEEELIQRKLKVVESELFINEAYAKKGFSNLNKKHSPETKEKIRKSRELFLHTVGKEEWYSKMGKKQSDTRQAKNATMTPDEIIDRHNRLSAAKTNRSEEEKLKTSNAMKLHWSNLSPEKRKELGNLRSKLAKERFAKMSQIEKELLSKSISAKLERIKCPHCDKVGIKANMNRWHFNNCKLFRNLR